MSVLLGTDVLVLEQILYDRAQEALVVITRGLEKRQRQEEASRLQKQMASGV